MKLRKNATVRAGKGRGVPLRYVGRTGRLTGETEIRGNTTRWAVEFPQRANPIFITETRLDVV